MFNIKRQLKPAICFFLCVSLLTSCKNTPASWHETEDGLQFWSSSCGYFDRYIWVGDSCCGVIDGYGILNKVTKKGEIIASDTVNATLGLINPADTIVLKNGLSYWGNLKKHKPHKLGVIVTSDSSLAIGMFKKGRTDSVVVFKNRIIIYKGQWKNYAYDGSGVLWTEKGFVKYQGTFKNGIYDGEGCLYNDAGNILYEGGFKNGLFHGLGTYYKQGGSITHVWKNGQINPRFAHIYSTLKNNQSKLSQDEYNAFTAHLLSYERYGGLWKACIILGLLVYISIAIYIYYRYSDKSYLFTRPKVISKRNMYLIWLLGGSFGLHRLMLASKWGFLFVGLVCTMVIANLSIFTIYAGHFSIMPIINEQVNFSFSLILLLLIAIMLLIDLIWISYRIYYLTNKYYRHDIRELEILQGLKTDIDDFVEEIAQEIPNYCKQIKSLLHQTKKTHKEQVQHSTAIGRLIKHKELRLAEWKYNSINSNAKEIKAHRHRMFVYSKSLSNALQEARDAAFRNIYLTKEVISYFKDNVRTKNQELIVVQNYSEQNIQIIELNEEDMHFEIDITSPTISLGTMFSSFTSAGISSSYAFGIAGIFAIGYVAIDYFKQKNVLLEKYTIAAKELVHSIDEMANDSVNIEATILRMNEILSALYECNKAYINAYVKIRDELFPEPTFINFIKQIGKKKANFSKISAADLGYLIEVTKYYNKINTSEV